MSETLFNMLSAIVSQTVKEGAKGPRLALPLAVAALQVLTALKVCCFRVINAFRSPYRCVPRLLEPCCQSDSDAQKLTVSSQDGCCIGPRPCCALEPPNTECYKGRSFCRHLTLERRQVLILWLQRMTAAPTAPREVCQNMDRRVPLLPGQLLIMKTRQSLPPREAIVALTVT